MQLIAGEMLTPTLRLERELGKGAIGEVWVATNTALGSEVAVKVLKNTAGDHTLARFEQEARGLAQLQSPHVVKIFDFGSCPDGEPFIVMELLHGRDLKQRIEQDGTLGTLETLAIITQVCNALTEAHARGVVHRDIKPANIFLTEVPSGVFVKVLDFGVAKFMDASLGMTATGALMGTPYYASPEQLLTPKDIDHRADLWALGVVTYACLAGALPFLAETLGALTLKINKAEFEPPTTKLATLPPALDAWMRKALQRNPDDRFASAAELAAELENAFNAPAELPMSTVMLEQPQTIVSAAPAAPTVALPAIAATAAMSPVLGQSTLSPTVPATPAPSQPPALSKPQAPARGSMVLPVLGGFLALLVLGGFVGVMLTQVGATTGDEPASSAAPDGTESAATAAPAAEPAPAPEPTAETEPGAEPTASATAEPPPSSTPAPRPPTQPRAQPKAQPKDDNPFNTRR